MHSFELSQVPAFWLSKKIGNSKDLLGCNEPTPMKSPHGTKLVGDSVRIQLEPAFIVWILALLNCSLSGISVKNIKETQQAPLFFCLWTLLFVGGCFVLRPVPKSNPQVQLCQQPASSEPALRLARGTHSNQGGMYLLLLMAIQPGPAPVLLWKLPPGGLFPGLREVAADLVYISFLPVDGRVFSPSPLVLWSVLH